MGRPKSVSIEANFNANNQRAIILSKDWTILGSEYGDVPTVEVKEGLCVVSGTVRVKDGKWNTITILPINCRPNKRLVFNLNNNEQTLRVDVLVDGSIVAGFSGKNSLLSLDGIMFFVPGTETETEKTPYSKTKSTCIKKYNFVALRQDKCYCFNALSALPPVKVTIPKDPVKTI